MPYLINRSTGDPADRPNERQGQIEIWKVDGQDRPGVVIEL